jgi:hypothetical protein
MPFSERNIQSSSHPDFLGERYFQSWPSILFLKKDYSIFQLSWLFQSRNIQSWLFRVGIFSLGQVYFSLERNIQSFSHPDKSRIINIQSLGNRRNTYNSMDKVKSMAASNSMEISNRKDAINSRKTNNSREANNGDIEYIDPKFS